MNSRFVILLAVVAVALVGVATTATEAGTPLPDLDVTTGFGHSCELDRNTGDVLCWGSAVQGQTEIPPGPFTKVVGGGYHTCAIEGGGGVVCWGNNSWMESTVPPQAQPPFIDVSADYYHTCVVDDDHIATCWGLNPYGETNVPAGQKYTQISIGSSHTCALKENQQIDCWGLNDLGQAEDKGGPFTQVSTGNQFSCGLRANQTIECWGRDTFNESSPPGGTFTQIDSGGTGSCAIATDGSITCWGGSVSGENTPPNEPGVKYVDISRAGQYHACAVREEQSVVCWGTSYPAPVPNIRPDELPQGNVGSPYNAMLEGPPSPDGDDTGAGLAPYVFTIATDDMPDGLQLATSGEITGTPTTEGSASFTVRMLDARRFTAYKEYTIEVGESTGPALVWGDSDCSGAISARDNQALLRMVLGQPALSQTEPCPDLGANFPSGGGVPLAWGDWDCNGSVGARDNQALLRFILSQPALSQTEPCTDVGSPVTGE
jgi:hypothetical protein